MTTYSKCYSKAVTPTYMTFHCYLNQWSEVKVFWSTYCECFLHSCSNILKFGKHDYLVFGSERSNKKVGGLES